MREGLPPRIDALTTMRFVAASMVLFFHTAGLFGFTPDAQRQPLQIVLASAVPFFFVLSGFILAWNYPVLARAADARAFYVARVARIFPLHWACIAFVLFLDPRVPRPWEGMQHLAQLPVHLLLLQTWWPHDVQSIAAFNAVSWTLSCDVAFYLLFPFLLPLVREHPRSTLALSLAVALGMVAVAHGEAPRMGSAAALLEGVHPLARLPEFVLGMVLAMHWKSPPAPAGARAALSVELAVLGGLLGWLVLLDPLSRPLASVSPFLYDWVKHVGPAPAYAALIATFAHSHGPVARFLCRPFCVRLGELSFAMYLSHLLLLRQTVWMRLDSALVPPWITFPLYVGTLLAIAWLLWRFVEVPSRAAIRRLARPSRAGAVRPGVAGAPKAAALAAYNEGHVERARKASGT